MNNKIQKADLLPSASISQSNMLGEVQKSNKELYIITDEDGKHYVADTYTEADVSCVEDGMMTIIRCSDAKQLVDDGRWEELPKVDW